MGIWSGGREQTFSTARQPLKAALTVKLSQHRKLKIQVPYRTKASWILITQYVFLFF